MFGYVAQNHHARAIFACFVLAPILCLPTFFVFEIKSKKEGDMDLYFLDANEDSELYRLVIQTIAVATLLTVVFRLVDCIEEVQRSLRNF
jgi:thyrotropin-releasing hormone receptor